MARILNDLNLLQETKGYAEMSSHRLTPHFVPCFVPLQPQPRAFPPKRRLEIAIEVKPEPDLPDPVKIIHTV